MATVTPEQFWDSIRLLWPDKSDEWLVIYVQRLAWYIDHNGDMTGAPALPEED